MNPATTQRIELSPQHIEAINRRRRVVVNFDTLIVDPDDFAGVDDIVKSRFNFADESDTCIDSLSHAHRKSRISRQIQRWKVKGEANRGQKLDAPGSRHHPGGTVSRCQCVARCVGATRGVSRCHGGPGYPLRRKIPRSGAAAGDTCTCGAPRAPTTPAGIGTTAPPAT
jgi:hypothetical protein